MSRRRAGAGWIGLRTPNGKEVHLICTEKGTWVTSGVAKDWLRCDRCRRPYDDPQEAEATNLCSSCAKRHPPPASLEADYWPSLDRLFDRYGAHPPRYTVAELLTRREQAELNVPSFGETNLITTMLSELSDADE